MAEMNRRDFLKISSQLALTLGLSNAFVPKIAKGLDKLLTGKSPVIWLQGLSCSGCSVSFLNADTPTTLQILTEYISLLFHSTLMTATGEKSQKVLDAGIEHGGYILGIEGSIPLSIPEACVMGHENFADLAARTAEKAQAIVAIGTCSTFGGVPAAENNLTGAVGVKEFLRRKGIDKPLINLPGCPCHPDWLVGTLVHVVQFGLPELDKENRPTMFYQRTIHDQCPRFSDFERERFAKTFSDSGCFFKLGCAGVHTYADCTLRGWNSGVNHCINSGVPCVGCASENFAAKVSYSIYTKRIPTEYKE